MYVTVAIAYLLLKTPYVFPIVGGRKVEHLLDNIEALDIDLTNEQIAYLESILPFDPGFPSTFVVRFILSSFSFSIASNFVTGRWQRKRVLFQYFCRQGQATFSSSHQA